MADSKSDNACVGGGASSRSISSGKAATSCSTFNVMINLRSENLLRWRDRCDRRY